MTSEIVDVYRFSNAGAWEKEIGCLENTFSEVSSHRSRYLSCQNLSGGSSNAVFLLTNRHSGSQLVLKLGNRDFSEKLLQMQYVDRLASSVNYMAKPLAVLSTSGKQSYGVWEFVSGKQEIDVYPTAIPSNLLDLATALWKNDIFSQAELQHPVLRKGNILEQLRSGAPGDLWTRLAIFDGNTGKRLLDILSGVGGSSAKLTRYEEQLNELPFGFVHTDIRSENVVNNVLVDSDNFRSDVRLVEFTRLMLLNVFHGKNFADTLTFLPRHLKSLMDDVEKKRFVLVLLLDMLALHCWIDRKFDLASDLQQKWMSLLVQAHMRGLNLLFESDPSFNKLVTYYA